MGPCTSQLAKGRRPRPSGQWRACCIKTKISPKFSQIAPKMINQHLLFSSNSALTAYGPRGAGYRRPALFAKRASSKLSGPTYSMFAERNLARPPHDTSAASTISANAPGGTLTSLAMRLLGFLLPAASPKPSQQGMDTSPPTDVETPPPAPKPLSFCFCSKASKKPTICASGKANSHPRAPTGRPSRGSSRRCLRALHRLPPHCGHVA